MSTLDLYDQALRDFALMFPRPMPKAPEPMDDRLPWLDDDENVIPSDRPPPTTWTLGDNPTNQDDEE